jgi:hypothetical protein
MYAVLDTTGWGIVRLKPMPSMLVMMKVSTPRLPMARKTGSNWVVRLDHCYPWDRSCDDMRCAI